MGEVIFEKVPTGRTHQVGGTYEPILGEDGEPEQEYVLAAVVDGHRVALQTFTVGYVEHMVSRPDTEVAASSSSSGDAENAGGADPDNAGDQAPG